MRFVSRSSITLADIPISIILFCMKRGVAPNSELGRRGGEWKGRFKSGPFLYCKNESGKKSLIFLYRVNNTEHNIII